MTDKNSFEHVPKWLDSVCKVSIYRARTPEDVITVEWGHQ